VRIRPPAVIGCGFHPQTPSAPSKFFRSAAPDIAHDSFVPSTLHALAADISRYVGN